MQKAMNIWKEVVETRVRRTAEIYDEQFGFTQGRSTTDAIFSLRLLKEKLHCVFIYLEKAYDRVPTDETWLHMRMSGVPEKCVNVARDTYDESIASVRRGRDDGKL